MKSFNRWTIPEMDILKQEYKNKTSKELSEILDRTKSSVIWKLGDLKIKKERKKPQLPMDDFSKKLCRTYIVEKLKQGKGLPHKKWIPVISKEMFYVLGVLQGDGSVSMASQQHRGFMYVISLGSIDKPFADEFEKAVSSIGLRTNSYISIRKPPRKKMYCVRSQSKAFLEWYATLDYNWVMENITSNEYKLYFLKGVFESEGSFTTCKKYTRARIRVTNYYLISTVKRLFESLGYHPTIFKMGENCLKSKKPYYAVSLNRKAEAYDFLKKIRPCITRKGNYEDIRL